MGRRLLERDAELSDLAAAARDAALGSGSVVLVHGEAGIGKTSLVTALRSHLPAEARMLFGACDALSTPRTLGPLRDLRRSVGPRLAASLDAGDRDDVFASLYDELASGPLSVLVVEDVHWADEATLDTLRFLVRRIEALPVVLVLTYRDDELEREHPLSQLLGDLGHGERVRRLPLSRLSAAAVASLTEGSRLDAGEVLSLTGGNPYFVTELVVSSGEQEVPATVIDAVLGRLRRLDPGVQDLVEQLAVVPSVVDSRLLDALAPGFAPYLGVAEERGLVTVRPGGVGFRHELTRRAVVDSLPISRSLELNRRALAALRSAGVTEPSRLVHHAVAAGDVDAVVRLAPEAAREAFASSSHREAAAHYRTALVHEDRFESAERADLWEACAIELYTIGAVEPATVAQENAVALRRRISPATALGSSLRWLSRMHWLAGHRRQSEEAGREATAVLEDAGDIGLLAMALSNESQLAMLSHEGEAAIRLAERAIPLAREAGDKRALSHALNNLGTARMCIGLEGIDELLEAARLALEVDDMEDAARAYVNLVYQLTENFRLDEAEQYLEEGMQLARRAEFIAFLSYMRSEHARLELARARWDSALALAQPLLDEHLPARCVALTVIGTVRLRRGDPDADEVLEQARELAEQLDELQRTGPVAAARAEAALLRGNLAEAIAIAEPAYHEAVRLTDLALSAELACRLRQAGVGVPLPASSHPFAIQANGSVDDAVAAWRKAGCPYHEAAALATSTDEEDLVEALRLLEAIHAVPLARRVRATLRERGVRGVPRGPATETRSNPAGLTDRQVDVLRLLVEGLTNAAIAERLVLSVRTVDSHVAAVFEKLGVSSRSEARDRALELDLGSRGG